MLLLVITILFFLLQVAFAAPIYEKGNYESRLEKARYQTKSHIVDPWTPDKEFLEQYHMEEFEMQPHANVWMGWTPYSNQNRITFTLSVANTGAGVWVGLGPSQTGGMIGGNPSVIMQVGATWQCVQMHSDGFYEPDENGHQNCELLARSVTGGVTTVQFERPLIGCKPEDIDIVEEYALRMIGAWGNTSAWGYHGTANKFFTEIWTFEGPYVPPTFPPGTQLHEFNLTLAPMNLPAEQDAYWCRGYELPGVSFPQTRYHIVIQDVLMFPQNIGTATYHHYIFFECPNGLPREYEDDENHECAVVPSPSCIVFYLGWAAGQGPLYFEHGLPIGAGEGAAKWGLIQSHIDNPDWRVNQPREPGWGAVITYTPNLTPIESGVFGLYGGVPLGGMPDGIAEYHTRAECPQRMIESAFGREGMYITSASPHMHGLGTYAKLELLREQGSTWVEPYVIWEQTAWDNNWQGVRIFGGDGFQVLPTDRLRCHCKYDTRNRTEPIRNGEGFDDEMCICYINYYPRKSISICAEFPPSVPSHPQDSGIGLSFADVAPFFWPIGPENYIPAPPPPNYCF